MNDHRTISKTFDFAFESGETIKEKSIRLDMLNSCIFSYKLLISFIINSFDENSIIIFEVINNQKKNCLVEVIHDGYMGYGFSILSKTKDLEDGAYITDHYIDNILSFNERDKYIDECTCSSKENTYNYTLQFKLVAILKNKNKFVKSIQHNFRYEIYFRTKSVKKETVAFEDVHVLGIAYY